MRQLRAQDRESEFYFITGADGILAVLTWRDPEELAKLCQFIVITHNNPVIQASDQIVGISMDKGQASSMVEVDMKKYEAPASNLDEPGQEQPND